MLKLIYTPKALDDLQGIKSSNALGNLEKTAQKFVPGKLQQLSDSWKCFQMRVPISFTSSVNCGSMSSEKCSKLCFMDSVYFSILPNC